MKKQTCCRWTCVCLVAGWFSGVQAAELVLVEKGVSRAPIVVFQHAPPFTRRAADELAEYIEKASGAKPQVIEGLPDPVPEPAIWVGFQPKLRELFPKMDFDFKRPEEIFIACDGKNLVIAGRDRWDPEHLVVTGRHGRKVTGWQQEFGTVNAVYTFLRDCLDVRWLWPGADGEDVLRKDKIAFAPFEYRYHPQIRLRCGVFHHTAPVDGRATYAEAWARFQRVQLDSSNTAYMLDRAVGGHGFGDWWERFHERHPEYFALQPDGTRSGFPAPDDAKICQSNPAVWDQWLADVAEQLKAAPTRTVFNGAFNDSWTSGHCTCERCRAWDVGEAPKRIFFWQGLSQEHVALSDRDVRFANVLARKLRQRYPDREYYVKIFGYGVTVPAPLKNVPDDNVIVAHVSAFFSTDRVDHHFPGERSARQEFADWAATGAKMWWRPNLPGFEKYTMLPDAPFGRIMQTFRFLAEHRCEGLFFDTLNLAWPTQGPFYYLLAHLAWDPHADGCAILDDYYRRGFGPAAEKIRAYWTLVEETSNRKEDGKLVWWQVLDAEFLKRAAALLDQADQVAVNAPEPYRRRIAHVRAGLEYTRLMIEVRELMARYKESRGQDKEAADKVRANWDEIMRISKENMIYMINLKGLIAGTRIKGLHPDQK